MEAKLEKAFMRNGFIVSEMPNGTILAQFKDSKFVFPIENKENLAHAVLEAKETYDGSTVIDNMVVSYVKKGLPPHACELVYELEAAYDAMDDVYNELSYEAYCQQQEERERARTH